MAAYAINAALGNVGQTVRVLEGVEPDSTHSLEELAADLNSGHVETLVILGQNPVYTAPASLEFRSGYPEGAAGRPAWADFRRDFALEPLARSGSALSGDMVGLPGVRWNDHASAAADRAAVWRQVGARDSHDSARQAGPELARDRESATGRARYKGADFDTFWQTSLHNGWVDGTAIGAINVPQSPARCRRSKSPPSGAFEVVFRPDPTIGDGTYSNNGWLQELPKPQTKMTWDNTVYISPKDAEQDECNARRHAAT